MAVDVAYADSKFSFTSGGKKVEKHSSALVILK